MKSNRVCVSTFRKGTGWAVTVTPSGSERPVPLKKLKFFSDGSHPSMTGSLRGDPFLIRLRIKLPMPNPISKNFSLAVLKVQKVFVAHARE